MRIEIRGGPHDGAAFDVDLAELQIYPHAYPTDPSMGFAGVPLYRHGLTAYLRWEDVQARVDNLQSIGPALDRVLLMMHEHEFHQEGTD
jgi:hypothetical protein